MRAIAVKERGLIGPHIFGVALGAVLLATGLCFLFDGELERAVAYKVMALCSAAFLVLFAYEAYRIITILRTPETIVSAEKDELYFSDGTVCKIGDVREVTYRLAHAKSFRYSWGTLTVTVGGKQKKLRYVADVISAHAALQELLLQAKQDTGENNG